MAGPAESSQAPEPRPAASFRFTAAQRLHGRGDFARVFDQGLRRQLGPLAIVSMPSSTGKHRLGLSVPRRVGNAVHRHHIKRLLREAFRLSQHHWPGSYDMVVVVRPHEPRALLEYQAMLTDAVTALHRQWERRQGLSP